MYHIVDLILTARRTILESRLFNALASKSLISLIQKFLIITISE